MGRGCLYFLVSVSFGSSKLARANVYALGTCKVLCRSFLCAIYKFSFIIQVKGTHWTLIMCYVWVKSHCMGKLLATPITQTPHFYHCCVARKCPPPPPPTLVLLTFPANCIFIHSSQFNEQGQKVTSASTLTGDGDHGFEKKRYRFHNAVTKSHPSHLQQNQTCSEIKVCVWLQVYIHFVVCYTLQVTC